MPLQYRVDGGGERILHANSSRGKQLEKVVASANCTGSVTKPSDQKQKASVKETVDRNHKNWNNWNTDPDKLYERLAERTQWARREVIRSMWMIPCHLHHVAQTDG
jgi:hypothetical protein